MVSSKASGSGTARSRSLTVSTSTKQAHAHSAVVLLTGFGPFPGVARNASAELAEALSRRGARKHRHLSFVSEILPVDWKRAPERLTDLIDQYRPALSLHFGVSGRATGFVVEAHAYNATNNAVDQGGSVAELGCLVPGDRPRRSATLPVRRLVGALQDAGYPAQLSADPGRYLCNAVLFRALHFAAHAGLRMRTGFIHIPATLEQGTPGDASLIGWQDAFNGGSHLLDHCLAPLQQRVAILSS